MARSAKKKNLNGSAGLNKKNSAEFFVVNLQKEGVIETESGLQYTIIDLKEGLKPLENSTVQVHQRISLLDGKMVDDTYKKNIPVEFTMEEAIPGYFEGLMLMSEGSRYKFFIPPELAWGKRGAGRRIGPNALLIIDVRLVKIV